MSEYISTNPDEWPEDAVNSVFQEIKNEAQHIVGGGLVTAQIVEFFSRSKGRKRRLSKPRHVQLLVYNLGGRKRIASIIRENGQVANEGRFDGMINEIAPTFTEPTVDDVVKYLKPH